MSVTHPHFKEIPLIRHGNHLGNRGGVVPLCSPQLGDAFRQGQLAHVGFIWRSCILQHVPLTVFPTWLLPHILCTELTTARLPLVSTSFREARADTHPLSSVVSGQQFIRRSRVHPGKLLDLFIILSYWCCSTNYWPTEKRFRWRVKRCKGVIVLWFSISYD